MVIISTQKHQTATVSSKMSEYHNKAHLKRLQNGVNINRHLQPAQRQNKISNLPQFRQALAHEHPNLPRDNIKLSPNMPPTPPPSPEMSKYERILKIGQGTFGEVYKVKSKYDNQILAMKSIKYKERAEGLPINLVREIKILKQTDNKNIIKLVDVFQHFNNIHLVLEFCHHDLAGILSNQRISFKPSEIKSLMKQLMNALFYIHFHNVIHRDLKPANILITKSGVLKLTDFGLARQVGSKYQSKPNSLTTRVVTLWYRAPELLLGDRSYSTAIDLWSVGCIMAEMWTRHAIMKGESEVKQLEICENWCGNICPQSWPGVEKLELFQKLNFSKGDQKRKVKERLRAVVKDSAALELIDNLLSLDPKNRIDADNALNHDYFWSDPMPCEDLKEKFEKISDSHFEFLDEARRKREEFEMRKLLESKKKNGVNYNGYFDRVY
ncbi:hypothetical protein PVAND_017540 [Polypedilum vanderplanki]|uniref:Protein kinase domain-containing protein n=1 Tax=Polypedilum vanderplanki TaxID=319348 RepID=A0A9J6BIZ3_POLVA|nr:hypothetical protein PVAND_017540 [Polypedilum vanderplanki]